MSWKIKKNNYFSSAVIQHQLEQKATSNFYVLFRLLKTPPVKDNIAYTPVLGCNSRRMCNLFTFLFYIIIIFPFFFIFQAFLGTCKSGMSGTCVAISRNCRLCLCAFFFEVRPASVVAPRLMCPIRPSPKMIQRFFIIIIIIEKETWRAFSFYAERTTCTTTLQGQDSDLSFSTASHFKL